MDISNRIDFETDTPMDQGPFGFYKMKSFSKFFCNISRCYVAIMELSTPVGTARTKIVTTIFDHETGKTPVSQQVLISVGYGPNPLTRKELRNVEHINPNYINPPDWYAPTKSIYERN